MQWYTSDQIPQRSDMINGRQYVKEPLIAYAETQPNTPGEEITRTKVYVNDAGVIVADNYPLLSIALTERTIFLDACYDQINRMNCAYIEGGELKLYWYDPIVPGFVTTLLGPADRCYLFMDDLRYWAPATSGNSNWLIYERDGSLYMRIQDDRYQTEELIATLQEGEHLVGAGMNAQYRVQLVLEQEYFETTWSDESLDVNIYTIDSTDLMIGTEYVTLEDI